MIFPWRVFVTIVPLLIAIAALQFFVPDTELRSTMSEAWWASQMKPAGYHGGFIGYATAASVHILVCITVIAFNLYHLWSCEAPVRRNLILLALSYAFVVCLFMVLTNDPNLAAYKLTYLNIRELYVGTPQADLILAGFSLHVLLPTLFGIVAVAFAATGAESLFTEFDKDAGKLTGEELKAKIAILKRGFQSLSVVLVSTVIAAAVSFHLPARLYDGDGAKLISNYADEVTIFWGAIFTLTLLATYAPHLFRLRNLSRSYAKVLQERQPGAPQPEWLSDTALFGNMRSHIGAVFTLLAPLITGSLGNIIQTVAAVP